MIFHLVYIYIKEKSPSSWYQEEDVSSILLVYKKSANFTQTFIHFYPKQFQTFCLKGFLIKTSIDSITAISYMLQK